MRETVFGDYFTIQFICSDLNEGDPVGVFLQSHTRTLPPPLALFDLCGVVLRKRFHLLLLSENGSELPPHLVTQIQIDCSHLNARS